MSEIATSKRPLEPDFSVITTEELLAYRDAENRFRASSTARTILGEPNPGAAIGWQEITLPGRDLPVRVYQPASTGDGEAAARTDLPLVVHVHGGGFVGTAVQCDWTNSHLAARLPALVVSVEHRLLAPDSPLANAADDGWDVLDHVVRHAAQWGVDPARTAVFGESCGALISALTAIRAREAGLELKAQVLVNPAVDVTGTMFDHPSIAEYAYSPTRALPLLRLFQRLAVPPGADSRRALAAARGRPERARPRARGGAHPGRGRRPRPPLRRAAPRGWDLCAAFRIPRSKARVPRHARRGTTGRDRPGGDPHVPPCGPGEVTEDRQTLGFTVGRTSPFTV